MPFERMCFGGGECDKVFDKGVQGSAKYQRLYLYVIILKYIIIVMGSTRPDPQGVGGLLFLMCFVINPLVRGPWV
jgi:hypothetical protein